MSKTFSSLNSISITGILADLWYLWLSSFALRFDHLIRQLVFVSLEITRLSLAWYETVQQPCEQIQCAVPGSKKKCECLFAVFAHLSRQAAFKIQISGVVFWFFLCFFRPRLCDNM